MELRAKQIPGPGAYGLPTSLDKRGGVISESPIPQLFRWKLKRAMEEPSPGSYADGVIKSFTISKKGVKIPKAKMKRYFEDTIAQHKGIPGPGGNTAIQSTLKRSGGLFSLAKPKTDIEWKIYRAKQLPGPKYTITNPDTTAMDNIQRHAKKLYRREYGTRGEDPYRVKVSYIVLIL